MNLGPMDPEKLRKMEAFCRELGGVIGDAVDGRIGGHQGFAFFLFSFNGPEMTWISNAQRADIIAALEAFIRMYRNEAPTTSAERN